MRYSIIIPIYDPEGKNDALTSKCILSVLKNSMEHEYEIIPVQHTTLNYSTAVNVGLKRATGDFLIILSNDVEILDPRWLEKYTVEDSISSFCQYTFYITGEPIPDASCWGMSRIVFNRIGLLDEQFKDGYGYEDNDYWMRCKENNISFVNVHADLIHHENQTYKTYFSAEKNAMTQRNNELFLKKWNHKLPK